MRVALMFDRAAARLASRLTGWTRLRVDATYRDWADALDAELEQIDGGWARLVWALGGLRLGWRLPPARRTSVAFLSLWGGDMHYFAEQGTERVKAVAYGILGFVAWWLLMGGVMSLIPAAASWPIRELGMLAACALGALAATTLGVTLLGYFLTAMTAFSISELCFHLVLGIRAVQGGPAHFAVMGAPVLSVALFAILRRQWYSTPAAAASIVLAFVIAEVLVHAAFGANPFRDRATHFAILAACVLGVMLVPFLAPAPSAMPVPDINPVASTK